MKEIGEGNRENLNTERKLEPNQRTREYIFLVLGCSKSSLMSNTGTLQWASKLNPRVCWGGVYSGLLSPFPTLTWEDWDGAREACKALCGFIENRSSGKFGTDLSARIFSQDGLLTPCNIPTFFSRHGAWFPYRAGTSVPLPGGWGSNLLMV